MKDDKDIEIYRQKKRKNKTQKSHIEELFDSSSNESYDSTVDDLLEEWSHQKRKKVKTSSKTINLESTGASKQRHAKNTRKYSPYSSQELDEEDLEKQEEMEVEEEHQQEQEQEEKKDEDMERNLAQKLEDCPVLQQARARINHNNVLRQMIDLEEKKQQQDNDDDEEVVEVLLVQPKSESITLRIRINNSSGALEAMQVKMLDKLQDLRHRFSKLKGINVDSTSIRIDGEEAHYDRSIQSYDLENGDIIDFRVDPSSLLENASSLNSFISLRVRLNGSHGQSYKLSRTAPLQKLVDAICFKNHLQAPCLKLTFDDEILQVLKTPADYTMQNYDTIEVETPFTKDEKLKYVKLLVRVNGKETQEFHVSLDSPLNSLIQDFFYKNNVNEEKNNAIFKFDGENLNLQSTPKDYDMEDGDLIDATLDCTSSVKPPVTIPSSSSSSRGSRRSSSSSMALNDIPGLITFSYSFEDDKPLTKITLPEETQISQLNRVICTKWKLNIDGTGIIFNNSLLSPTATLKECNITRDCVVLVSNLYEVIDNEPLDSDDDEIEILEERSYPNVV